MPKIGAHVSAAGSLNLSFERAEEIGAECTQIFISPPQQWVHSQHSEEEIEKYRQRAQETKIEPNFIHAAYLINLATPNPDHLQKSVNWLIYSQQMANKFGMAGTILHLGSYKDTSTKRAMAQVIKALRAILDHSATNLILENSAGAGNLVGDSFFELGQIIRRVNDPHLKVCLDTQHAFASGYELRTKEGIEQTLTQFKQEIGLGNLVAIHANDSKTEFSSKKDRHENIGQGLIGLESFRLLINHPNLQNIPFILEIPGEAGRGPDKDNLAKLKLLRGNSDR